MFKIKWNDYKKNCVKPQLIQRRQSKKKEAQRTSGTSEIQLQDGRFKCYYTDTSYQGSLSCCSPQGIRYACDSNNINIYITYKWINISTIFTGSSEVKMSASNAGDPGLIPESKRSPGKGNGNPLQYLAWRIPWTEEPGRLQSTGLQRVGHN